MAIRGGRPPLAEAGGQRAAALELTVLERALQDERSISGVRVAGSKG